MFTIHYHFSQTIKVFDLIDSKKILLFLYLINQYFYLYINIQLCL
jgi:hypothetical protein